MNKDGKYKKYYWRGQIKKTLGATFFTCILALALVEMNVLNLSSSTNIWESEKTVLVAQNIKVRATYAIKEGDTLWDLASRLDIPLATLTSANPYAASKLLQIGEKINIPPGANIARLATNAKKDATIPNVPFLSQFKNISSSQWQQVGCGVTSLAMIINFYKPDVVSVDNLLQQGIAVNAYDYVEGWTFKGLVQLAERYGLSGRSYDFSNLSATAALNKLKSFLSGGPIILAVHNGFDPKSTVPHLVVVDGIKNGSFYYNDPAAKTGKKKISADSLLRGWKQKMIVLRPIKSNSENQLSLRQ